MLKNVGTAVVTGLFLSFVLEVRRCARNVCALLLRCKFFLLSVERIPRNPRAHGNQPAPSNLFRCCEGDYECLQCAFVYKPGEGGQGALQGTEFDDLPSTWVCPVCRAPKVTGTSWYIFRRLKILENCITPSMRTHQFFSLLLHHPRSIKSLNRYHLSQKRSCLQ